MFIHSALAQFEIISRKLYDSKNVNRLSEDKKEIYLFGKCSRIIEGGGVLVTPCCQIACVHAKDNLGFLGFMHFFQPELCRSVWFKGCSIQ